VDEVGERKLVERLPRSLQQSKGQQSNDFQVSLLRKGQPPFSEARLPDNYESVMGITNS